MSEPVIPGIYRHFKGGYYLVLGTARNDATDEPMVVYVNLYDHPRSGIGAWTVRTLQDFTATVDHEGAQIARFTYIGPPGTVHAA